MMASLSRDGMFICLLCVFVFHDLCFKHHVYREKPERLDFMERATLNTRGRTLQAGIKALTPEHETVRSFWLMMLCDCWKRK